MQVTLLVYSTVQYSTVQYSVQVTLVVYIPQELLAEVAGGATTATSWLVTRSFQDIVRLVNTKQKYFSTTMKIFI